MKLHNAAAILLYIQCSSITTTPSPSTTDAFVHPVVRTQARGSVSSSSSTSGSINANYNYATGFTLTTSSTSASASVAPILHATAEEEEYDDVNDDDDDDDENNNHIKLVDVDREVEVLTLIEIQELYPDTKSLNFALRCLAKGIHIDEHSKHSRNGNDTTHSSSSTGTGTCTTTATGVAGIGGGGIGGGGGGIKHNHSRNLAAAQRASDLLKHAEEWFQAQEHKVGTETETDTDTDLQGPVPDTYSYTNVMNAWSRAGRFDRALEVLQYMNDSVDTDVDTDTDSIGTSSLSHSHSHSHTRNMQPNTITYNSIINSLDITEGSRDSDDMSIAKGGDNQDDPLDKNIDGNAPAPAPVPVPVPAPRIIPVDIIQELLQEMNDNYKSGKNEYCRPNAITYNILIKKWAFSGRKNGAEMAELYLRELWILYESRLVVDDETRNESESENSNKNEGEDRNTAPDVYLYATAIQAWARFCGDSSNNDYSNDVPKLHNRIKAAKRAEQLLREMEVYSLSGFDNLRPNTIIYSSVIHAWAQCGEAERAEAVLNDMDNAYRDGNEGAMPTSVSYNSVVNAWAKSAARGTGTNVDSAQRALDVLQRMEDLQINSSSKPQSQSQQQSQQQKVKPDIFTYTSVINALSRRGTEEAASKAKDLLDMIEARYEETKDPDIKPNIRTFTSVINAISRTKVRPERAEEILTRIENSNEYQIDVVCYNAVVNAWGWSTEANKAHRANQIFQRMIELHSSGENVAAKPDVITLNSLLNACAFTSTDDKEDVSTAVDIAINAYELFSKRKYGALNHLTYGTMLMIFNKLLPKNPLRTKLMKNICYHCCQTGNLSGLVVTQLLHGMPIKELKQIFGRAVIFDKSKTVRIDRRRVPKEWSKNESGGSRSRPSKKHSNSR